MLGGAFSVYDVRVRVGSEGDFVIRCLLFLIFFPTLVVLSQVKGIDEIVWNVIEYNC